MGNISIEVRKKDGSPVMLKSDCGTREYTKTIHMMQRQDEFFSFEGINYGQRDKWLESLPTYHRGKLKSEIQASKNLDKIIISEEIYNDSINAFDGWEDYIQDIYPISDSTYNKIKLLTAPWLVIYQQSDVPNVIGLYQKIEKSYCNSYSRLQSFEAFKEAAEKFADFDKFRKAGVWQVDIYKSSDAYAQTSINVKVEESGYHFVTHLQEWQAKYWSPLFTTKTKRIVLSPNIETLLERKEEKDNEQRAFIAEEYTKLMEFVNAKK